MGFLKRLFSMGGKKNSKSKQTKSSHNISQPLPLPNAKRGSIYNTVAGAPYSRSSSALQEQGSDEEDHEAAVHRLLRTSSARYAVVNEVDYTNLPPMPHPINAVLHAQNTAQVQKQSTGHSTLAPSASTASLASTTISTRGGSGTYNVTVYRKQRLSQGPEEVLAAEKKNKKRESAHLNANDSRMMKLRSEPSVVSLLSLYDEQGRLPEGAFSNDLSDEVNRQPAKVYKEVPMANEEDDEVVGSGKAQCKRSGSTLRQLLGALDDGKSNDASEGDISWAERFLGELETSSVSSQSSFILPTPTSEYGAPHIGDVSEMTIDDPAISSMDVELSISTDASEIFGEDYSYGSDIKKTPSYESTLHDAGRTPTNKLSKSMNLTYKGSIGPGTPQKRASQVFEFIKKRASKFVEKDERDLPDPPSAFSSPSSTGHDARSSMASDDTRQRSGVNSDEQDEEEVNMHLKSQFSSEDSCESAFAKEKINAIHMFAPESTPTTTRKRPASERVEVPAKEGGLDHVRGMMKRLSFNRAPSAEREKQPERAEAPAPAPSSKALETPMRPAAGVDVDNRERVLMTGPTKVIVTAPTPGTGHHTQQTGYSLSRVPKGPRGPNSRRRTSGSSRNPGVLGGPKEERPARSTEERRRSRQERENSKREGGDKYKHGLTTNIISTPRKKVPTRTSSHRSTSSVSSTGSNGNENTVRGAYGTVYAEAKRFVESVEGGKIEMGLGVKSEIPLTPLRTSRRTSVNQEAFFQPPQPQQPPSRKSMAINLNTPEEVKEKRREREKGLYAIPGARSARGTRSTRV